MCKPTQQDSLTAALTLVTEAHERLRGAKNILQVAGLGYLAERAGSRAATVKVLKHEVDSVLAGNHPKRQYVLTDGSGEMVDREFMTNNEADRCNAALEAGWRWAPAAQP